ncbi:type III effector [Pseudomonas syringae]|uniref:Type III effector n=1 Tax=Pseudomonas syringae TaxID=317 RepID=A0A9Q4FHV3_PSESX|nr:type III effector [Pseudomonas syringae]MCF5469851.1 type III effector [Pseudomonas syringae]MCF5473210.1 type III effector [Pseudomonas syringae]MCF5483225.1 type III effector [Pseudomonas syringae]MCF5487177.1 type III effector [Pseudomonas syringae]MCF5491242.1 type III effector [Pseudomonas syringae]
MNITPLTSTTSKGLAVQDASKIAIPNSTRMINASSMRWLNKGRCAIGNHISTSIEKGKLFELTSLGDNMFGVPAISERNSTHHPVLRFEPDPDHDLNLVRAYMQDSAGKLSPWEPLPDAVTTPPPQSLPDAQAHSASSSLPRRPPADSGLSSSRVALNQAQRAEAFLKTTLALRARNAARKQLMDVRDAIQSGREDSFNKKISATEKNAKGINYV